MAEGVASEGHSKYLAHIGTRTGRRDLGSALSLWRQVAASPPSHSWWFLFLRRMASTGGFFGRAEMFDCRRPWSGLISRTFQRRTSNSPSNDRPRKRSRRLRFLEPSGACPPIANNSLYISVESVAYGFASMAFGSIILGLALAACLYALSFLRPGCGPPTIPIFGSFFLLGKDHAETFRQWSKQYGELYRVQLGSNKIVSPRS
jgi:hypothetical protein